MNAQPQLRHHPFLLLLGFVAAGVVGYLPAFHGERVWDDSFLVGTNAFFRSPWLALEAFQHGLFYHASAAYYRPLQNISYMLDYLVWGENLFGYHLTNALLHALAAFLLVCVLLLTSSALGGENPAVPLAATAAGALWLVHPMHHAVVAYVSGRADSLAAVFALGAWLTLDHGLRSPLRLRLALFGFTAGGLAFLALCSKEIAFAWIALIVLFYCAFQPSRPWKLRVAIAAGAALVVAAYAFLRQSVQLSPPSDAVAAPFAERLLLMLKALGDYFSIIAWPWNLHMERALQPLEGTAYTAAQLLHYRMLLPLGLFAAAVGVWTWVQPGPLQRIRRFSMCWFLISFLPISNLFPLNAAVAEHWVYMPSAALVFLLVLGWLSIPRLPERVRILAMAVAGVSLLVLTSGQSRTWVSEEQFLWTTLARGGNSVRARSNLARVLLQKGEVAQAEEILRNARRQAPEAAMLQVQLADLLSRSSRPEEALALLSNPATAKSALPAWSDQVRVETLLRAGRENEARHALSEARQRHPSSWPLARLEAMLHQHRGQRDLAIGTLRTYLTQAPWQFDAVMLLAQNLAAEGRLHEAAQLYGQAARLDIRAPGPWEQLAQVELQAGNTRQALQAQRRAVRLAPFSPVQRFKLAEILEEAGRSDEAAAVRAEAAALLSETQSSE